MLEECEEPHICADYVEGALLADGELLGPQRRVMGAGIPGELVKLDRQYTHEEDQLRPENELEGWVVLEGALNSALEDVSTTVG